MSLKRRLKILHDNSDNLEQQQSVFKIAFASNDMKHVNQHFGSAQCFIIYDVYPGHNKILEVIEFGELAHDGNEDKLMVKLDALSGCLEVYFQAIGASAVRKLLSFGIKPVKVSPGEKIATLLQSVQQRLASEQVNGSKHELQSQKMTDADRFNNMEADGWQE